MTFVEAKHHGGPRPQTRFLVVHTTENDQSTTAAQIANFFAHETNPTSAHGVVDDHELIRCVHDPDIAYHAGTHANEQALGLEHIGRASFTAAQWNTPYTDAMLALSARQFAAWCMAYRIPAVRISAADLLASKRGICGHADVSKAWPADTTHTDPGSSWPWDKFLALVRSNLAPPPEADMTVAELDAYFASEQGKARLVTAILGYKNTALTSKDVYAHILAGAPMAGDKAP